MKIKKKTSVMMIAAATAAVVGVAAVSFAAWQSGDTQLTANASTGTASIFGFNEEAKDLELGTLVPYDQDGTYEGDTIVSVEIPEYSVDAANYTVTVSSETELTLYVLIGAKQTDVPDGWSTDNAGDWLQVTSTGAAFNLTAELGDAKAVVVSGTHISLMLVSSDNAEMSQTFSLTVELSK